MEQSLQDIKVAVFCAVHQNADGTCEIEIPDLNLVQKGRDFPDAQALATLHVAAIYEYDTARGLACEVTTSYEEAEALCKGKKDFPYCIIVS